MLVRSPLLTSHKWRELVSSGRLVCRWHDVFLRCYVCFVLLRFSLYAFVEAAALRSIVLHNAGAPIATRVSFFLFFLCLFGDVAFSEFLFCAIALSLCMQSTLYVLSFRIMFLSTLCPRAGFLTSAYVRIQSINQSINQISPLL